MESNFTEKYREFPLQLILVDDQVNLVLNVFLRHERAAAFWSASSKSLSAGHEQWSFPSVQPTWGTAGELGVSGSPVQESGDILEQVRQVAQGWLRTQSISPMRSLHLRHPGAFREKAEREMLLLSSTSWSEETKSNYSEIHSNGKKAIRHKLKHKKICIKYKDKKYHKGVSQGGCGIFLFQKNSRLEWIWPWLSNLVSWNHRMVWVERDL